MGCAVALGLVVRVLCVVDVEYMMAEIESSTRNIKLGQGGGAGGTVPQCHVSVEVYGTSLFFVKIKPVSSAQERRARCLLAVVFYRLAESAPFYFVSFVHLHACFTPIHGRNEQYGSTLNIRLGLFEAYIHWCKIQQKTQHV